MRTRFLISAIAAGSLVSAGQGASDKVAPSVPKLLLSENAYNPIPSPDGRFIAYVKTGWGEGMTISMGRSSLTSNVGLMDTSGKVLKSDFAPQKFLAEWSADSKEVVCYRDWTYAILSTEGTTLSEGRIPQPKRPPFPERVAFLNDIRMPVWQEGSGPTGSLVTGTDTVLRFENGGPSLYTEYLFAPSPDGRYVATIEAIRQPGTLWVYDRKTRKWSNLGDAAISPDRDWDYLKSSWDPWFADSSHLAYFSGRSLLVSSPDGESKRALLTLSQPAGLAVPSPSGEWVAYVAFDGRPMKARPDLTFWGNSAVWVVQATGKPSPRQLTQTDPDTTSGLRWLGNDSLVFDRISENHFEMHARIWSIALH
ncbi:MAG TPA: hypothetical protein VGG72_16585 [Bryobacteraceae bacterium]|jgi:Tol biopolymer transport system component